MNGFFITLRKFSKESAMYLLYATCFFCLLFYVGNFGGSFISVLGNLFLMVVEIALWLAIPVLLSIGKQEMAKSTMRPIFTFWLLYTVFSYLTDCTQIVAGLSGTMIAMGVFEFLFAGALIVIAALTIVASLKKDLKYKKIALLIFAAAMVADIVLFSLRVAVYAEMRMRWHLYLEAIYKYLTLPFGMFFAGLHFEFTLDDMILFEVKVEPKDVVQPAALAPAPEYDEVKETGEAETPAIEESAAVPEAEGAVYDEDPAMTPAEENADKEGE